MPISDGNRGSRHRPKLLYLVTEDWYFCSHRLPIARSARDAGYEVLVATRVNRHAETITREGFKLIPIGMRRSGTRPWREIATLLELIALYRRERPHLVHHVSIKPVIYGSIAAHLSGVPAIVNALAGLGFVFTSKGLRAALLRPLVKTLLRILLSSRRTRTIVQNPDDRRALIAMRVPPERVTIVPGSGVDTARFQPTPEPPDPVVVTLVSRMLWDKGVGDLVESARLLRAQPSPPRVLLVGTPDPENPASIPIEQLHAWQDEGVIEWLGHSEDVAEIWAGSHIAVLPSHREGLPKALLEAAACARPLIATDVPGCREVVVHGENGYLVPARDANGLAERLLELSRDAGLRRRFGACARRRVVSEFGEERVVADTLELYRSVLNAA